MGKPLPKIGDIITLDCGYGGGPNDRECIVLEKPESSFGLFGDPRVTAKVRILGTDEVFDAVID